MFQITIQPFVNKLNMAKKLDTVLLKMVEEAYGKVTKSIIISLSGPIIPIHATRDKYPCIGTIPIPRRKHWLYWSAQAMPKQERYVRFFWLNPETAPYAHIVHDGGGNQASPRPVFQIQFDYWRPIIFQDWDREWQKFLRRFS